jgi:hypothetical protein
MGPEQNDGLGQGRENLEVHGENIITNVMVMYISLDFNHW